MSNGHNYTPDELAEIRASQEKCTWASCHLEWSYFDYRPHKAANLAFAVLFGLCAIAFLGLGIRNKKWLGFTIAMVGGCVLEVVGYAGRYMAYEDLWSEVCV